MKQLILLILILLPSCTTTTYEIREKTKFIDIQTYTEWGTTRLTPIGRRPLPTQNQICNNPLWMNSEGCRKYHWDNKFVK